MFLFLDIVKNALLRRMAREAGVVLTDSFLTPEHQAKSVVLYERIGNNFVNYIEGLSEVKTAGFLFLLAGEAVKIFQDNLDLAWIFAYDGHCKPINWLPVN
jgi:hypothetical protein